MTDFSIHFNNPTLTQIMPTALRQLDTDFLSVFDTVKLPEPLNTASRYAMANGGKRVRPLLLLASFLTVCPEPSFDKLAMARRAMMAVEFIHGYSLVHDDLPCMDNDELRRGKPTCHIVYGESVALLIGDVLQSLAFDVLTMPLELPTANTTAASLLPILASRARRMVAGQQLDLNGEQQTLNQQQLERIHKDKTGALIEAATMMGGVCAGGNQNQITQLANYARTVGLAFQVQDDVLDVISDTATLGKPTGSDEKLQKSTYVRLLGTSGASDYAKQLFDEARDTIATFGEHSLLMQLTDWLQKRTY